MTASVERVLTALLQQRHILVLRGSVDCVHWVGGLYFIRVVVNRLFYLDLLLHRQYLCLNGGQIKTLLLSVIKLVLVVLLLVLLRNLGVIL